MDKKRITYFYSIYLLLLVEIVEYELNKVSTLHCLVIQLSMVFSVIHDYTR